MTHASTPPIAGHLLIECLIEQGVERAYGVPGESYLAVLDGFHAHRDRIRFITCRQEGGASFMAEAEGKLKKQSGGHGQFAVVQLRVSPRERGAGSEFVDSIVGGAIPRNYLPAVEKGVEEAMAGGGVFGFPVVDVRVECYDGKYHAVDSSDMAFRTAAAIGLKEAMAKANGTEKPT